MPSPQTAIAKVGLSPRERCALELLGVSTVADFMRLDLREVFDLPGFWGITYTRLMKSRAALREALDGNQPDWDIATLDLSEKELNALRQLGARTVGDFLPLDLAGGRDLRNCGVTAWYHLKEVQAKLRVRSGWQPPPAPPRPRPGRPRGSVSRNRPRCKGSLSPDSASSSGNARMPQEPPWQQLPFFSGIARAEAATKELPASCQPSVPITALGLDRTVERVLAARRIVSLGQLLLAPPFDLGERRIARARSQVRQFLEHSLQGPQQAAIDLSSPEAYLMSVLKPVLGKERDRWILLERLGWRSAPCSLAALGRAYGLTRERVRQLQNRGLSKLAHWRAVAGLWPLREAVDGLLAEVGPLVPLGAVAEALQLRHRWNAPVRAEALAVLVSAHPELRCVEKTYVAPASFRCTECPALPEALRAALAAAPPQMSLTQLARRLRAALRASPQCRRCGESPAKASLHLARLALERSALEPQFRLVGDTLWRSDQWERSQGPLYPVLESLLKEHPGPMSYRELQVAANRVRQQRLTPGEVWHALRQCVSCRTEVLLWARGGVYRHVSQVDLRAPVFVAIERWLVRALQKRSLAKISAQRVLEALADECRAAGLPTAYAIHSCLKHRGNPKLVFFTSPYLGLAAAEQAPRRRAARGG